VSPPGRPTRRRGAIACALAAAGTAAIGGGCGHAPSRAAAGGEGEIVWSGEVRVAGLERIPEGRALRILPGTRVVFDFVDLDGDGRGDAGIETTGSVHAEGTPQQPIRFAGARAGVARWGEVRVEDAPEAVFTACEFSDGSWPLHVHRTPLRVERCRFSGNEGGMRFTGGPVAVRDSDFAGNGTAVRYWASDPEIAGNRFAGNGTAIFVREASVGSLIRGNDFVSSEDYHVKLGEAQPADVAAPENWWGTVEEEAIERMIFDREDTPYLGRVRWRPAAAAPWRRGD